MCTHRRSSLLFFLSSMNQIPRIEAHHFLLSPFPCLSFLLLNQINSSVRPSVHPSVVRDRLMSAYCFFEHLLKRIYVKNLRSVRASDRNSARRTVRRPHRTGVGEPQVGQHYRRGPGGCCLLRQETQALL